MLGSKMGQEYTSLPLADLTLWPLQIQNGGATVGTVPKLPSPVVSLLHERQ